MKQTSKRFYSMIAGLVFLAAALIVYFEFIQPAYDEAQSAKSSYAAEQTFISAQQTTIKQVEDLISSYEGQSRVQDAVSSALPTEEDVAGAVAQLYGLATQSALSLQSLSVVVNVAPISQQAQLALPSAAAAGPLSFQSLEKPVGTIAIQMKLSGQYENLKQFVSLLGTNIRIFDVKTLSVEPVISPQGTGPGKVPAQTTYNFSLSVTTYYQGQ